MNNPQKDKTSSPQRHGQTQSQQTQVGSNEQDNLQQFSILLTPAYAAFSQIIDGLFLTGVGGMTFDNFRKNKITNIINCTREAPNWRLPGVECFRIAVDDSPTEDLLSHLDSGTDKIYSILSNGGRAVVHCVAGVSRSASVVIAYLIKYKKMNLRDAYNHVQSRRRVVRPNNGFFKQLIAFEKKILGSNSVKMVTLRRDDVQIEIPDFFEKEHKRFVILETLKVKAASLRTAQSTTPATMAASTSANSNPIVTNESSTPQNSAQSSKEASTINSSSKLSSEEEKKLTDSSLDHISKE